MNAPLSPLRHVPLEARHPSVVASTQDFITQPNRPWRPCRSVKINSSSSPAPRPRRVWIVVISCLTRSAPSSQSMAHAVTMAQRKPVAQSVSGLARTTQATSSSPSTDCHATRLKLLSYVPSLQLCVMWDPVSKSGSECVAVRLSLPSYIQSSSRQIPPIS